MTVPAEPIFFLPICKEKIWGGSALCSLFERPLPPDRPIGESWEVASLGSDQSVVAGGPLAGATLGQLVNSSKETLLGKTETFGRFPLLYKFIDAHTRLSVQVHPDDRQSASAGWGAFGKTECWYVVDAQEHASIIVGFKKNMTTESLSRAIETASLDTALDFIPVQAGDLLFIPAGTVHAILEGTLLYEVQQSSDTTLRLYDWGRADDNGRPRPLHVRDALSVIDMQARRQYRCAPLVVDDGSIGCRHSYGVACRYFSVEKYEFFRDSETILPAAMSFRVLTVMSGTLELIYPAGSAVVPSGTTVLLPAILREVRAAGTAGAVCIVSKVPDLQAEVITPLRKNGFSDDTILALGGFPERNDLKKYI